MLLSEFLEQVKTQKTVSFNETIAVIMDNYDYTPSEFSNGLGDSLLINAAGTNEGSCKIFAFAKLHSLDAQQTLNLFGDFYRVDVLNDPDGSGHPNIRNFMRYDWEGIGFASPALQAK
jgi:hypothetical protein